MKTFADFYPFVLFTYFISVLIITMFTTHPVLQLIALTGFILLSITIERKLNIKEFLIFFLVFCVITITNPLFSKSGETVLIFINNRPITKEALLNGMSIGAMIIAVIYLMKSYSRIMTSDKFLFLFGSVTPKLAIVISIALRFIPLFIAQSKRVSAAQKTMGLYSGSKIKNKLKNSIRVFSSIVTWSLENAIGTADSMQARGYGLKHRTNYSLFKFSTSDAIALTAIILLTGIVVSGFPLGIASFSYYPHLSYVNTTPFAYIIYIAFGLLVFLPTIIEFQENLKWNSYKLKI